MAGGSSLARTRVLFPQPMNFLTVGTNKAPLLEQLQNGHLTPEPFLLSDDTGKLISRLKLPPTRKHKSYYPKITHFDVSKHHFNLLKDITYETAVFSSDVIYAAKSTNETLLTRELSENILLDAFLSSKGKYLDQLLEEPVKNADSSYKYAYEKLRRILLSPVLKRVLCTREPGNVPFDGILLVQLDSSLPQFDRFILVNLLVSRFKGQIVVSDIGRYGCGFYEDLIDQNRLIAGVNYLDETPLKRQLLQIENKIGSKCLLEDAQTLTDFAGHPKGSNKYNEEVERRMK